MITTVGSTSSDVSDGVGARCARRSCAWRTTSTTEATGSTVWVALSLSRVLPLDALAPIDVGLRAAMSDLDYPTSDDYHALNATGISRWALTLRDGRRQSTNDAYLEPARTRSNLYVRGDVFIDRVLIDGRRATGVRTADGEEIAAAR